MNNINTFYIGQEGVLDKKKKRKIDVSIFQKFYFVFMYILFYTFGKIRLFDIYT